jgi:hypothetical protein
MGPSICPCALGLESWVVSTRHILEQTYIWGY